MKTVRIISCLLLLCLFCLSACTEPGGETYDLGPETGTISFYVAGGPVELTLWDSLISKFEQQNPGIKVEKVLFSSYDTVFNALQAGNAPDVIQMANAYAGNWAKVGAVKSLQPLIDMEGFDKSIYFDQIIQMFSYDRTKKIRGTGDLFALPKDYGVYGIYVNLTLLESSVTRGLITEQEKNRILDRENPMTFAEYKELTKKLTVKNGNIVTQFGTNSIMAESYLWSAGTDLIKDGKYLNADDKKVQEIYQYIADMANPEHVDYCSPSPADTESQDAGSMFLSNKIVMFWGGRWLAPGFDAADMRIACIPVPVAKEGGTPFVPAVSAGYAISRNSKKIGMAWKFIKFMASEEAYKTMYQMNYLVPPIKSLADDPFFSTPTQNTSMKREDYQVFINLAKNAKKSHADYFTSNRWYDLFNQKFMGLFEKNSQYASAGECLKAMEKEVNAAIRSSDPALFN